MAKLSQSTIIGRGSDHVETKVGGQTMMMSVSQGKYYALEATAQRIWELIETPQPLSAIVDNMTREYDVAPEDCAAQVQAFVAQLMDNGLAVETGHGRAE